MKKLIGLIIIISITGYVFGQPALRFNEVSVVQDALHPINENNFTKLLNTHYFGFSVKDTMYILSYRINDEMNWKNAEADNKGNKSVKRDLILYRNNGKNWIEASNIVQTDFCDQTAYTMEYNILNYVHFGGKVFVLENGCVFMLISNMYGYSNMGNLNTYKYNAAVILIPNGNGTFIATRYIPYKKTSGIELNGTYCTEITNNDNKIQINFYDGDKKNPIKRGTLNFIIENKCVYYSGDFNLTQAK